MSTIGFIVLMVIQISLLIDISSLIRQLIDEREHEKRMLEIDKQTEQGEEKENENI